MLIFDPLWLEETERHEDFSRGLEHVTTHMLVKSLRGSYGKNAHCQFNRTNGALLMPTPDSCWQEALQICRPYDPRLLFDRQGVVWNFPLMTKGEIEIQMQILSGGLRICLCDRWFNACDDTVYELASFSFKVTGDVFPKGCWHKVVIRFDTEKREAWVWDGERKRFRVRMREEPDHGICYLHMQSAAEQTDYEGSLVKQI